MVTDKLLEEAHELVTALEAVLGKIAADEDCDLTHFKQNLASIREELQECVNLTL